MNGPAHVLRALHEGEHALEQDLLALAERHRAEQEVHHVALDLARWSHEHLERLARATDEPPTPSTIPAPTSYRDPVPDLLADLCHVHLVATWNSLHWEMLGQAAQVTHDHDLLDLTTACHPRTLRQMRWTNTMIKTLCPQLLTTDTDGHRPRT